MQNYFTGNGLDSWATNKVEIMTHKSDHSLIVCKNNDAIQLSDIEFLKELGQGAFGKVYKAKYIPKDKIVACKVLEYNPLMKLFGVSPKRYIDSYIREISAYNELNSNYIVKMIANFLTGNVSGDFKLYLVMEYMEKGSLTSVIEKEPDLTYRCRLGMASNIATGMRRIHEKSFIHRDIRPDNILVSSDYVAKIADMGIAKLFDASKTNNTMLGCSPYMPKEFYRGEYTQKLDIFTFGLSMYHLFSGKQHSFDNNIIKLEEQSPVFQDVIDTCLNDDPKKRPTAEELEKLFRIHYRVLIEVIKRIPNYTKLGKEEKFSIFVQTHNLVKEKFMSSE